MGDDVDAHDAVVAVDAADVAPASTSTSTNKSTNTSTSSSIRAWMMCYSNPWTCWPKLGR